ncbi:DUF4249 domain-containing protein [uncultured Draconibacterium sp.]|uniref:DUF4249 domain-containing protein n=1 Tax=uncultured Draconibacterium sp. TaxID=1573823 RepID=UPI003216F567
MKVKKFTYQIFLLCFLLGLLLENCVDPYRPKLNEEDAQTILVVDGLITTEPGSFNVELRRSVPLDTMPNFTSETGASVYILDDRNQRYDLWEAEPGIYRANDDNAKAEIGVTYQLFITDAAGVNYESSPVLVQQSPEIGDLDFEEAETVVFEENEAITKKALDIFVNSDDASGNTNYYQWDFVETFEVMMPNTITALDGYGMPYETTVKVPDEKKYCWVSRPQSNILVKTVANQTESTVSKFTILRIGEYDDRLFFRYSIKVRQYSISKEMYTFWNKLKDINESAGSLYDQVPSSVYGNISSSDGEGQALGYFNAVDAKSKRIFIEKYDHSVPAANFYEDCLYVSDPGGYHFVNYFYARSAFCADCRNYGSNEKPDFW